MNIDLNLFQFFILLLPGYLTRVLAHNFSKSTIDEEKNSEIRELLNIVLISINNIIITDVLISGINRVFGKGWYSIYSDFFVSNVFDLKTIVILLIVSIIIGIIICKLVDSGMVYKILNDFNITENKSNETAWQYFNKINKGEWIIVIDYETRMKYIGYFGYYEIDGEDKNVILTNVTVYHLDDKTKKYERKNILLKCNKESIVMEVTK